MQGSACPTPRRYVISLRTSFCSCPTMESMHPDEVKSDGRTGGTRGQTNTKANVSSRANSTNFAYTLKPNCYTISDGVRQMMLIHVKIFVRDNLKVNERCRTVILRGYIFRMKWKWGLIFLIGYNKHRKLAKNEIL